MLFGREHYNAVLLVQIVIDVATCFVIADLARRTVSERAARFAFLLAALCPFTANYTVAPLAETLSIFFAAVALDAAVAGFAAVDEGRASVAGLDVVRRRRLVRHSAASRWRHSADRARAVSAVADVAPAAAAAAAVLGRSAGAGDLDCAAGSVDDPQLA